MKISRSCFLSILILGFYGPLALALVTHPSFVLSEPLSVVANRGAALVGRQANVNEKNFISDTFAQYFKKAHPGERFSAERYRKDADTLENGELDQGWRDEVATILDGMTIPKVIYLKGSETFYQHFYQNSPISTAKKIAKEKMFETLEDNWNTIGTTVMSGDMGVDCPDVKRNCPAFRDAVVDKFDQFFHFSWRLTKFFNDGNYYFDFENVGLVQIDKKNPKVGKVIIGISYLNELNKLQKGAENIRTDYDAGLAPPPAPAPVAPDSPPSSGM